MMKLVNEDGVSKKKVRNVVMTVLKHIARVEWPMRLFKGKPIPVGVLGPTEMKRSTKEAGAISDINVAGHCLDASLKGEVICGAADGGSNAGAHDEAFAINTSKGHFVVDMQPTNGRTTAAQDAESIAAKMARIQGIARTLAEREAADNPSDATRLLEAAERVGLEQVGCWAADSASKAKKTMYDVEKLKEKVIAVRLGSESAAAMLADEEVSGGKRPYVGAAVSPTPEGGVKLKLGIFSSAQPDRRPDQPTSSTSAPTLPPLPPTAPLEPTAARAKRQRVRDAPPAEGDEHLPPQLRERLAMAIGMWRLASMPQETRDLKVLIELFPCVMHAIGHAGDAAITAITRWLIERIDKRKLVMLHETLTASKLSQQQLAALGLAEQPADEFDSARHRAREAAPPLSHASRRAAPA